MLKKLLISIIVLYFLVLVQTSFMVPNFTLLFIVLWNIFENPKNNLGLYNAVIAGFFLDIFSNRLIGFNILILFALAILLKFVFKKYVQIPFIEKV